MATARIICGIPPPTPERSTPLPSAPNTSDRNAVPARASAASVAHRPVATPGCPHPTWMRPGRGVTSTSSVPWRTNSLGNGVWVGPEVDAPLSGQDRMHPDEFFAAVLHPNPAARHCRQELVIPSPHRPLDRALDRRQSAEPQRDQQGHQLVLPSIAAKRGRLAVRPDPHRRHLRVTADDRVHRPLPLQ